MTATTTVLLQLCSLFGVASDACTPDESHNRLLIACRSQNLDLVIHYLEQLPRGSLDLVPADASKIFPDAKHRGVNYGDGFTPLHACVFGPIEGSGTGVDSERAEVIGLLVSAMSRPLEPDAVGRSPLDLCIERGDREAFMEIVQSLSGGGRKFAASLLPDPRDVIPLGEDAVARIVAFRRRHGLPFSGEQINACVELAYLRSEVHTVARVVSISDFRELKLGSIQLIAEMLAKEDDRALLSTALRDKGLVVERSERGLTLQLPKGKRWAFLPPEGETPD